MEFSGKCPNCGKELALQQINFKTAIVMCLDLNCPYPCYSDCLAVNRSIENINKPIDLHVQLRKLEKVQNNNGIEQVSEASLIMDLEDLLKSHDLSNLQNIEQHKELSESLDNQNVQNFLRSTESLEFPELDEFLNLLN